MEKHTKKYLELQRYFNEIQAYIKGSNADVDVYAHWFWAELFDVNIQWKSFYKQILHNDELAEVQTWINKITGNCNVSKHLRRKIIEESLDFNEMVEVISANLLSR